MAKKKKAKKKFKEPAVVLRARKLEAAEKRAGPKGYPVKRAFR